MLPTETSRTSGAAKTSVPSRSTGAKSNRVTEHGTAERIGGKERGQRDGNHRAEHHQLPHGGNHLAEQQHQDGGQRVALDHFDGGFKHIANARLLDIKERDLRKTQEYGDDITRNNAQERADKRG